MQRSLAASSIACAQHLDQLASLLRDPERAQLSALQQSAAEDQSTRFQVWAGNLGAFQRLPATASLDHRLRESPRIATQIHELLEDLKTSAEDVRDIVLGERPNRRSEPDVEIADFSVDRDEFSDYGSAAGNDESEDEAPDLSEAEEIFESIKDTITSLFRLAVMIRKSTPRDRYARALGGHNPFIEDFDIAHVGHKFEKLDADSNKWLKERLGKAITQRRQYLRYAREHRYKLGKEPAELWKPAVGVPKANLQLPIDLTASQAGRTNTSRPATTLADTTASTLFLQETTYADKDFQDDQSQTSYAFSAVDEDDDSHLKLPRLSEVAKGQSSFECPFCWTIQTFRREKAWKKHALSDLRPYVCTFEDCDLKMFPDRKIWFEHEMKQHRAKWHCHFCEQSNFKSAQSFCEHIRSSHGTDGSQDQLNALAEASKQPLTQFSASDCPFCLKWDVGLRKSNPDIPQSERVFVTAVDLRRHIGSHMQDLALFAIPRGYLEEGEGDAASKASARAAGVGKDSASIAMSNTKHSSDSYDSAGDLVVHHQPVDVEQCARSIEAAMRLSDPALEETLVNILPALNDTELGELQSKIPLSSKIASSPRRLFASIAQLASRGQIEADKVWLQTWHTYPQESRMWWNVACSFLGSNPPFLTRLRDYSPGIRACIEDAFRAGDYPPLFCDILQRVAFQGRSSSERNIVENEIMIDVNSLRSGSAQTLHNVTALFTRSNRYLRKLVRFERKWYPESSIFPSHDNPLKDGPSFNFEEDDMLFLQYLLGHVFAGATDPVSRDVNYLHAAFQVYGPQSFHADAENIDPSVSNDWQSLIYQILNLHWNKSHLRAVKSMFEDEYSATLETFIERLYDPTGTDNMFIPLLKALVNVDSGEDMIDFSDPIKSRVGIAEGDARPISMTTDTTLQERDHLTEPITTSEPLLHTTPRDAKFSIYKIALLKVVFLRMETAYHKERTLQHLLQTIPESQQMPTMHAWIGRLSRYPIFEDNRIFFGNIKPFLTLRVYEPGEIILAKSEAASWAGWLIVGRITYTASYNPNDSVRHGRRQWTTSENAVTFGLVSTLLELPSLSHNVAETACVVAQIRKADFKRLVREHKEVEQHLVKEEFGTSFAVARECLRIEIAFGRPWWHIFDPGDAAAQMDLAAATSKILQEADNPKIITALVRSMRNMKYTPLDLVLKNKNIEAAKLLLESGAEVRSTTIKVALDGDDADFVELLLTRPGAAEAANEVLRSGHDGYVPKLQAMLKDMQGRVSLVTASSLETDADLETQPEPMNPAQSEIDSFLEDGKSQLYDKSTPDGNGKQIVLAAADQDPDHDESQEISATYNNTGNDQASNGNMLAKRSVWASPMSSIRQRWGGNLIDATGKGGQARSPSSFSGFGQIEKSTAQGQQIAYATSDVSSNVEVEHQHDNDLRKRALESTADINEGTSTPRQHISHTDEATTLHDVPAKMPSPSSVPLFSSEFDALPMDDEFWTVLDAFYKGTAPHEVRIDRLTAFFAQYDKSLLVPILNGSGCRNELGDPPLVTAINHGDKSLVALFLEHGADPNIKTAHGQYPLDYAHFRPYHSAVTSLLLQYGATNFEGQLSNDDELNSIKEKYGKSWFDIVAGARLSEEDKLATSKILADSSDPRKTANLRLRSGQKALDVAVQNNDVDTMLLLIENDAQTSDVGGVVRTMRRASLDDAKAQAMNQYISRWTHVLEPQPKTTISHHKEIEIITARSHEEEQELEEMAESSKKIDEDVKGEEVEPEEDGIETEDSARVTSSTSNVEERESSRLQEQESGSPPTSIHPAS